jgi:Ni,Fe-hydrogenase III large subunit
MTALVARSGKSVALGDVPILAFDDFRKLITSAPAVGKRISALFGVGRGEEVQLFVVVASDQNASLELARTKMEDDKYPSMTLDCPEVHLFEREIAEQWGIVPEGHPWLKPVRYVRSRRQGRDAWKRTEAPTVGVTDFYRVEGEEVHEVAVGPVHAGVIEPGHFRFQCHGEHVFHLEIALGYQHRGVERALGGGPTKRTIPYMETLAGDTTIGHVLAYCCAVEALSGTSVPARAHALRGIALELERLANHTGDLGALAGDVGYLPTASYCGRLRGDFLNLSAVLCGNRFGRGLVRPGGVVFDVDDDRRKDMLARLDAALRDVRIAVDLLWNSASVQARFEGTGVVSADVAAALGLVGVAARASGLERDVRQDHPSGIYRLTHIPVSVWNTGDVFARAFVRWLEIQRSCAFIKDQLDALPRGATRTPPSELAPNRLCVSLVEGWRGEICHVALTDDQGRFSAYKVVDPSFHNWTGLAMALRDQQISDFPLCNKSFNLSYCGHDL